jgi:hypothetical protein
LLPGTLEALFVPGKRFLICAPKVGHKQKVNEKE